MRECYLCKSNFEITEDVFQTDLLYARISIKREVEWKDMVLTVFVKNSEDEDVLLCKTCFSTALSRCAQEVQKTSIPMTAGIQFRGS
ncbi:MAG: hypothetical protein JSV47_01495 [Deltaproteobacteria bacterium]|jgi:hypothetical protein|nr:MAG: hypothetical protein JSV47_01495 [Deltaproteobacteria bacterium]